MSCSSCAFNAWLVFVTLLITLPALMFGVREASATNLSTETVPGRMPAGFTPPSVNQAALPAPPSTGLSNQFFSASGKIYVSVDAAGSNSGPASIGVNKKTATSTVRSAFLLAASTGFSGDTIPDGSLLFQGAGISWDTKVPSGIFSENYLADVTSIVKPVVDAAAAGIINLTVDEGAITLAVDGEVLAVVFDDSSQTATHSIVLLFGAQATAGDTFAVTLAQPIDPTAAGAVADFGLGISFGYQVSGVDLRQYSIVEVNGQRLSTSAGGQDDCRDGITTGNGCLITAGGIGDSNANPPDPFATPTNARSDDELYSLLPFMTNTATSISVFTQNPSNDDNIFFAYFDLSAAGIVGPGIVLGPDTAMNPVGTSHTVTATVVDSLGQPVSGLTVTFNVISGPNAGISGSAVTDTNGHASFTYTGLGGPGTDQIQASFVDATGNTVASNIVTKTWTSACGDGVVDPGEQCDPAATPTGCSGTLSCTTNCTCECVLDTDCDDNNVCTLDSCRTGTCVHDRANEGLSCNDGNGVCLDGQCVPPPPAPIADVDVFTACRPIPPCPDGTVSCDIHVFNHGPSAVPQLTVDMDLTNDLQVSGTPMALKVFTAGGAVVGMGPAPTVMGQHLEWTASDVPAGGKSATWFVLQVGTQGGTKTVSARGSIPDPDPSSNTRTATITPDAALCPPADFAQKGVDPEGLVCTTDSLFYVLVFQHPGATTASLTDALDPCLDPSTVSALMPEPECTLSGTTISCSGLALDASGRGQVSFAAKPALGCPAGATISNQAQVTFDDSLQLTTNATSNQLQCPLPQCMQDTDCNDGNTCTTDTCNIGNHTCVHDRANEGLTCNGDAGMCLDGQCETVPSPPSADVDVFTVCRPLPPCPDGTVSCDIHVFNHGPSAVPQLTVDMDLTNDLQVSGTPMALKVFTGAGAVVGMGPAPSVMGQHLEWTASNVPAGGKAATWFVLQVGTQGGTKTVSAQGSVDDPNPANNTRSNTITPDAALCPPDDFAQKGVDPSGAVCPSDSLFYVLVFQHPGATTADLTDVLDPCLDPTTVSALMPEPECTISGTAISCSGIPLDGGGRGQVSFAAKPRLECAVGTVISNQAQVTFHGVDPDPFQLSTNPTTNQLVDHCECIQDSECDDGNACTDDACVNRSCSHTNNTLPCDDGLFCTVGDTCGGGSCTGTPRDCSAAGDQCNDGVCNEAAGACQPQPKADTTTCSDGDACTTGDHCSAGNCVGGPPPNCDDGNECTADSCDHAIGCVNDKAARNGFACDDGNFCTERDACSNGICKGVMTGSDSDGDGYCDFQEIQAGCNPFDFFEVPPQPVRWAGLPGEGNIAANGLLTYASPAGSRRAQISVGSDPSCATSGVCGPRGFCIAGKIGDPCATHAGCSQPANTCRVVINYGGVSDLALTNATLNHTPLPGFTPVTPGCARKVDVTLDPSVRRRRLRLRATGTVGGRSARDLDRFWYIR